MFVNPSLHDETDILDALALANRLRPILMQISRHLRRETHLLGVSNTQVSLLATIACTPNIGLSALAEREGMTTPTISNHIDRLESAGFVTRQPSTSGDRRRVALAITEAGQHVLDSVRAQRTAWLARHLETLPPADRAALVAAIEPLHKLVES
jgi:DNA-binding MarR family transcriptional regulator